ncbi:MAG: DUF4145 domain-containing protein [Nitrosopumilaceae archaeon]
MKCPHCTISFFEDWQSKVIAENPNSYWNATTTLCPNCKKNIIYLAHYLRTSGSKPLESYMVQPRGASRPLPSEVPDKYSIPFHKAVEVLSISAEASAAISRKCLQNLLREEAKVKPRNLADEIQEVIDSNVLPSDLAESIDAIRNIGKFASHPIKSTNTGELVDVEEGEAEWTLDVLEDLFDYYLVKPAIRKQKRDALNKKLQDAGKQLMK